MTRRPRPLAVALPLLALLVLLACTGDEGRDPEGRGCEPRGLLDAGEPLPDCTLETFDGSKLALTSLRGRPAVLNFWASWCGNCIREMPAFQAVADELEGRVRFVGANLVGVDGETRGLAQRFARERGVRYTLAWDPDGNLFGHFSATTSLPVTILVRADGRVAFRKFGELEEKALRDLVRKHLGV